MNQAAGVGRRKNRTERRKKAAFRRGGRTACGLLCAFLAMGTIFAGCGDENRGENELSPAPTSGTAEPGTDKPAPTEPGTDKPAPTEPGADEPAPTEPGADEPAPTEPGTDEPAPTEPGTDEPAPTEPGTDKPAPTEPGTDEPTPTEPGTDKPAPTEPGADEPTPTEPGTDKPAPTEPGADESNPAGPLFGGKPENGPAAMRDLTTMEFVHEMGLGINLGNTFESCGFTSTTVTGYETGWGSPVITPKIIEGYAKCGFGVLRIPVAWSNLMEEDYTISEKYLLRVKTVVNSALDSGLHVILNIHWDGGWWTGFAEADKKEECMTKYTRIWTQLTEAFRDYGDGLMFESLNEEGCWDSLWNRWGGPQGKTEAFALLNEINQKFVDIVRASGGNNEQRHLLIAGYGTDIALTCDELFAMPQDPANRMAVSVHYYTPSTFAILDQDAEWGKMQRDWGTEAEYAELARNMDMMKEHYIDKGIPVIIGEYGSATKNKEEGAVTRFLTAVCEAGYTRGMCPVLWDITNVFYNRNRAEFYDQDLLEKLNAVKELPRAGQ